jgi:ribosome maturation factor RimP
MDRQTIINELRDLLGSYLKGQGLDLVDLIYRYEGRNIYLRILVDKPEGGISLGECARLNNEISRILDEKDILRDRYMLEVSSPGLDRPLLTRSDFLRCIDRNARFFFLESINGKTELEGVITKVEDNSVYIDIDDNTLEIPLAKIKKAKQIISKLGD